MAKERAAEILHILKQNFSIPQLASSPRNAFQTLIRTVISQATANRNTTRAFENLSKRFSITPKNLSKADEKEIEKAIDKPLFYERRGMPSRKNDQLVSQFKSYAKRGGAVLLGVQGGRSSEGADYPSDTMNSVVVVGVPYAQPTPRTSAQVKYYESCFPGHGREYGYVLPALKKASQAAGRPIRTLDDRGAIVFLDYRFATKYCQRFLPLWIRRGIKTLPDEDGIVAKELILFFGFPED